MIEIKIHNDNIHSITDVFATFADLDFTYDEAKSFIEKIETNGFGTFKVKEQIFDKYRYILEKGNYDFDINID